jgi:phosphatidylserine/phosphatidylglycerophosphate/cardiolipin synthase-like enzyme
MFEVVLNSAYLYHMITYKCSISENTSSSRLIKLKTFVGKGVGKYMVKRLFNARREALICSPWLSEHYADAIIRMVRRGIRVKLITSNKRTADFRANDYFMGHWKPDGQTLDLTIMDSSFIHAKMYVVDEEYAVIGSANLTEAGMYENVESIVTYDGAEVVQIRKEFEKIWKYNGRGIANGKERGYQSVTTYG